MSRDDHAHGAGAHRLPEGGRIDRGRRLGFTFNGARHDGLAGDTLASALLANGIHLVGRSFKYHRPRGIVSAGAEEPNALVQLGHGAAHRAERAGHPGRAVSTGWSRAARTAGPRVEFDLGGRQQPLCPAAAGRLLLQDLHVAGAPGGTTSTSA